MRIQREFTYYKKRIKKRTAPYRHALNLRWDIFTAQFRQADIAFFHRILPPPTGGRSQFFRALGREMELRGWRVEHNTISSTTRACLFNASSFDRHRLRRMARAGRRLVHRIDGPVGIYRGYDDGTDTLIQEINKEFADVTILQSHYSLKKYEELGMSFTSPHVVMNAVDPAIFYPDGRIPFNPQRAIRLVSVSWSDNPNKGAAVYKWLEEHLDWNRFEYTFVGRSPIPLERTKTIPPVPPEQLATILRQHDIYVTASQHESCSNSVLEALACGLPVIYIQSGSMTELVGEAGFGFTSREEIPGLLERLVNEYPNRQKYIQIPTLKDVCDQYLTLMGMPVS